MFQTLDCRAPEFSTFLGLLGVQAAIDMRFTVHPLTWYGVVPLRNMRRDPSSKRQVRMRV